VTSDASADRAVSEGAVPEGAVPEGAVPEGTVPEGAGEAGRNRLTDPVALRALAHPLRLKLLGFIGLSGTLTATEAAGGLKVTPAAASYHLRSLAKYGFIEDAGGASWRERPWRLSRSGASFGWDSGADDPAARALTGVVYAEWLEHIRRYQAQRERYPADVRQASGGTEFVLFASTDEVVGVRERIKEILEPFRRRIDPAQRPPDALPIEILVFTHPLLPPGEADAAHDADAISGTDAAAPAE
jgi:DNA-binding transcriptional ArsR family regulator